ncbi:MAG: hypothetical protein ABI039_14220, partial [Vicinamibacterales bacterium]
MPSMRAAILASVCLWQCGAAWPVPVRAQLPTQRLAPQPQLARQVPPPPTPQQAPRQPDTRAALTDIGAIRALSPEAANERRRAHIRGTITYVNEREPAGMIVHDGRSGLFVHYFGDHVDKELRARLRSGDVLDLRGYTSALGFAPTIVADDVTLVGRGSLPIPKQVSYAALLSGEYDCAYLEIVGVGQRAWLSETGKTLFVDVAVEGGVVRAWFWQHAPDDLSRFVDARIRIRGNAGTLFNQARQVRGITMFGGRASDVTIEAGAPDPWSLPVRPISSLYTHHAKEQSDRRVRLRGTVTATRVGQPVLVEDLTMNSRSRAVRHEIYV